MTTGNGAAVAAEKPAAPPPKPAPFKISVSRGRKQEPHFIFVYGVDGVGKSTFASKAPRTFFIDVEGSTDKMDVDRTPATKDERQTFKWVDILSTIRALTAGELPEYQTLTIDTVDAAEALLFAHICAREGAPLIGDVAYGRGYDMALDEWRLFVAALEQLQSKRGMHVILLGHAQLKTFRNPMGDDFDRYSVKMNEKAAAFLRERAQGVYFAQFEQFADKDKKTKRVRGISTDRHLLYTRRTAAFDAKDRYGLPAELALDWTEFESKVAAAKVASDALKEEIGRKAKELGGDFVKKTQEYLAQNANDAQALELMNSRLNALLAEKAEQAQPTPAAGQPAAA